MSEQKPPIASQATALDDSDFQFRRLVAGVADYAIYMLSPDGTIMSWNTGAERIKGYASTEVIGRHFSCFYTPEDRAAGVPIRALATAAREGKYEAESWRLRKDGTRFWASVVIDAVHDDAGKLIGFAKVTRDMTERREMQEQLLQSQKMEAIGQLTGGVAHDFNNLLTVIIGNLETISRHIPLDNERLRRAIEHAGTGAQRAAALTQQLLAFARRQPLNPRTIDINRLVASMTDLLRRTLGETISIETALTAGLRAVSIDPHQLESALLNLAVNARDAMSDGGTLTIRTGKASGSEVGEKAHESGEIPRYVTISVTDTGTGMGEDVVRRAFEPFFTTKAVGRGTGLGLSQVQGFVLQSGGHVRIASQLDRGTTVKLYLPELSARAIADDDMAAPAESEIGGNETLLVVEDELNVRAFSADSLRELGYNVLEANDGSEALRVLEQHPQIALLFTDVGLPRMNGRQLAELALQLKPDLKVLFTSGYSRDAIVHDGRLDPGIELINKPFTRAQLAARIRMVLDQPAQTFLSAAIP